MIFYGTLGWINVWLVLIDYNPSFKELYENEKVNSGK